MAEPFMPAHESADTDPARRDTTIADDDVVTEPDNAPADVDLDAENATAFRTPVVGDKLTAGELAKELQDDSSN
ncbi:hypothetical protein [Rathayibacter festucae]|uniref:hypothetical protein n=1 Tax=Rathayibacter festucae TaxID=110937 RepID=UPI002A6AC3A3|nr:hypothetical protein [Rathayibacter festucae]MDY0914516.1 hypothetical protein [Rathayibacter festucae]